MDWKTIGTFAAVIAAIFTIAFNAFVQRRQLRRERMIALKKALYSLMEIWYALMSIDAVKFAYQQSDTSEYESISDELAQIVGQYKIIQDNHFRAVELLSGENPVLAVKIRQLSDRIDLLKPFVQFAADRLDNNTADMPSGQESVDLAKITEYAIEKSIKDLERNIKTLSQLCGRHTRSETAKFIESASAKRKKLVQKIG